MFFAHLKGQLYRNLVSFLRISSHLSSSSACLRTPDWELCRTCMNNNIKTDFILQTQISNFIKHTSMPATSVVYFLRGIKIYFTKSWVCWLFSYQFIDVCGAVGASLLFAALTTRRLFLGFTFGVFLSRWGLLVFLPWSHCVEITERSSGQQEVVTPVGTGKL